MQEIFKKFGVAYLAGALGGVAYALLAMTIGHWGVFHSYSFRQLLGGHFWSYLAPLLLRGSLWALLMVPLALVLRVRGLAFGLIMSLIPSIYILIFQYPQTHHGSSIFTQSPQSALYTVLFWAAWGIVSGSIYISHYQS